MGTGADRDTRPTAADAVERAITASGLAGLPEGNRAVLLADAVHLRVPAGSYLRREGDPGPHVELVVAGLVRVFVSAPDGRTLTVRYCRPGALLGAASLFRPDYVMPGGIQALIDSEILALRAPVVQSAAASDLDVAAALLGELSDRVVHLAIELPGSAFGTVRQRVARHLLDLASTQHHERGLVAQVSQQDLAAAVGSVREVVVRVLADLRREGLVETGRGGIRLLDPGALAEEAQLTADTAV